MLLLHKDSYPHGACCELVFCNTSYSKDLTCKPSKYGNISSAQLEYKFNNEGY